MNDSPLDIARETAKQIWSNPTAAQTEHLILTAIQRASNSELEKRRAIEEQLKEWRDTAELYRQSWLRLLAKQKSFPDDSADRLAMHVFGDRITIMEAPLVTADNN